MFALYTVLINLHYTLVDCTWSDWTEGECSMTCGEGIREKTRVMYEEQYGGAPCSGEASAIESCNLGECPGK